MDYLRIKNWEEFQHYKDRLPPWIKLHRELLTNYDFCHLPDETKGHLMMTWLLASQMGGRIPDDAKWVAARIGANKSVNLELLKQGGWLVPDDSATVNDSRKVTKAESIGWGSRHIPDEIKREVWVRDSGKCKACAGSEHIEYDHVVPVSKGGASTAQNVQLLCRSCNRKKRTNVAAPPEHERLRMRSVETETYKATEAEAEKPPGALADWIPKAAWQDFVAYRKQQKGWTSKAETLLLRELEKLHVAGHDPTAVIEQSIANGWKGLFPLRGGNDAVRDELAARKLQAARNMDILTGKVRNDGRERDISGVAERVDSAAVFALPGSVRESGGDDVEGLESRRSTSVMGG